MNHFHPIQKMLAVLAVFSLLSAPLSSFASSVTFAPASCPAQIDLSTYLTSQIDDRVSGLTASDATKKIFTTQDFSTQTYVRNPSVWTNSSSTKQLDLTGISSWNTTGANTRAGTLISPRHIVFATHYQIDNGATIVFVGNDNTVATRTLANKMTIAGTDITVGVLDSDVPSWVTYYPIIPLADLEDHLSTNHVPILLLDQEKKALVDDLVNINGFVTHTTPPENTTRSLFHEDLIGGDSGSPAFIIIDGKPVLMFTHYSTAGGYGDSYFIDQINSTMASLGGGYEASSYDLDCFNHSPVVTSATTTFALSEHASLNALVATIGDTSSKLYCAALSDEIAL